MSFKGVRSFCREISSIFVSMMNRANNIMLLNTPARARLITSVGILPCAATFIANVANGNNGFLNMEKKNSERFSPLITLHLSLQFSLLPPPSSSTFLEFTRVEYSQVHLRKLGKETAKEISSPLAKSLFTLERVRKYASHRNRRRDERSCPRSAPGYASNFRRCGCRAYSREENTDGRIRNLIYGDLDCESSFFFLF